MPAGSVLPFTSEFGTEMYRCSNCGEVMDYPQDKCPHCGSRLTGVRCNHCRYVGSKSEFIVNGHRCPACGSKISLPSKGTSLALISGILAFLFLFVIGNYFIYQYFKTKELKEQVVPGYFTDPQNGVVYKTVRIFNQEWMAENLNVTCFTNGYSIPEAKTNEKWLKAGTGNRSAWCGYENDTTSERLYGKLYNWHAVAGIKNLCPEGWHVPSAVEWDLLIQYLGRNEFAGGKMKSLTGWAENGNGDNFSGFSGLPGGIREGETGNFHAQDSLGYWWSATENTAIDPSDVLCYCLRYHDNMIISFPSDKSCGLSVRCVRYPQFQ
jgi:uncharacterized protein (TIGR02145 family)